MKICKPDDNLTLAVLSWLHVLLLCSSFYVLIAAATELSDAEFPGFLASCLWLIIPAAASWIFVRRIRTLAVYLLCSAAVCALVWTLSSSAAQTFWAAPLTTVLCALLFLVRCTTRIKKGRIKRALMDMPAEAGAQLSVELWEIPTFLDEPAPAHFAVFAICYAGILPTGQYHFLKWVFFLLLAEVFVCFIHSYLRRMWDFIRQNQKIANLPAAAIQKVSRVLLLLASVLLLLAVLPSALYGKEPLIGWLENIHALPAQPAEDYTEMMAGMGISDPDFSGLAEAPAEPPAWLLFLSDVLMYVSIAAAVLILLAVIYHICRNAVRYFSQDEEDEILFLGTEEREKLRSDKAPRKTARDRWTSPSQRIRRLYKKTLRRTMPQKPAGWETPHELEEKAGLLDRDPDMALHDLYEKARYSESGCTAEDLFYLKKYRDV